MTLPETVLHFKDNIIVTRIERDPAMIEKVFNAAIAFMRKHRVGGKSIYRYGLGLEIPVPAGNGIEVLRIHVGGVDRRSPTFRADWNPDKFDKAGKAALDKVFKKIFGQTAIEFMDDGHIRFPAMHHVDVATGLPVSRAVASAIRRAEQVQEEEDYKRQNAET